MKYITTYSSSNGQPSNGHEIHETLNAALRAWESNISSLLYRSGGDSTLEVWEEAEISSEHPEPIASISWLEHCEGGFVTATGDWSDEIAHLARHEQENGETLTAAKVVRRLSE
jgi:hypothetical protein